jgi:EAL domain-containing protein (putative c-di-GMP-specific phosphodiesterase class I)
LLKGMNAFVIAEGVLDDSDVQALWQVGVDAVTGPWATQQRPRWGHLEE